MRVKICGHRTVDDIRVAVNAGADAIGLIVGARHVSEDDVPVAEAAQLLVHVPVFVATVLVTHLQTCQEILSIHHRVPAQAIQLHDKVAPKEIDSLRGALPSVRLIGAVHVTSSQAVDEARREAGQLDALVLDSRTEERIGGTGRVHDWSISAEIVRVVTKPIVLAGGLTPENVAEAIATVRPYAVDVNSGVDDARGNKDAEKVTQFVKAARGQNGASSNGLQSLGAYLES